MKTNEGETVFNISDEERRDEDTIIDEVRGLESFQICLQEERSLG